MCIFCDAKKVGVVFIQQTGTFCIEDVERGAELTFSGPLRGPLTSASRTLHHRQILFSNDQILVGFLVSDRTDGRTDGQTDGRTDRRNKYVLGLPCFKKLSSEFGICIGILSKTDFVNPQRQVSFVLVISF